MRHGPYFWLLAVIGAVFAAIAVVAGFWMFAPIVIAGILFVVLVRTHRSRTDHF